MIDFITGPRRTVTRSRFFLRKPGLPYRIIPVNIGKGEQFKPEFLAISPNNRMPAIVDHTPTDGGAPISVFESGAILLYLAEKTGQFSRGSARPQVESFSGCSGRWAGSGRWRARTTISPNMRPEKLPYAIERYVKETNRLYGVLEQAPRRPRFRRRRDYSIADMASYPWIVPHERQGQKLEDFPHLKRWFETIAARPAAIRAYEGRKQSTPGRR